MKIASPQWHDLHAEQLVSLAQQQDSESAGRLCSSYLVHKRGGSWSQAFLAASVETEDKNRNVTGATKMFCKESLRKINAKYLELFRRGSVHKFCCLKVLITLEQLN